MQEGHPRSVRSRAGLLVDQPQARGAHALERRVDVRHAPGQVVVSGHAGAVARAIDLAKEKGARRSIPLPVSAPFHCRLMQPAQDLMAEALAEVGVVQPAVPLVANVTAAASRDPDTIREGLVEQVTAMVRWRESVLYMKENDVDCLVEVGAGRVLSGLARRIDRDLEVVAIGTPEDIDGFVKSL